MVAFFTVTGLELSHRKSRIAMTFQEFACEDCDLLRVIRSVFPSMNTLLYINLLITINQFFISVLYRIT